MTEKSKKVNTEPGQGIRELNATTLFRITNFELFVKPVINFIFNNNKIIKSKLI